MISSDDSQSPSAFHRGSLFAIAAAVLFGLTAPAIEKFGAGAGAFPIAALLYIGATTGARLGANRTTSESPVRRTSAGRILVVAVLGAAIAPALLVWGIARAGALATSLLLNLEAVATVILARLVHREPLGRRVVVALALATIGGGILAARAATIGGAKWMGVAAVSVATICWALDNTFAQPLADLDPRAVVFWKSLCGGTLSLVAALVTAGRWPEIVPSALLVLCGVVGYGWSMRLYLRAQRELGAGRTASLFAIGPFVGALVAVLLGDHSNLALVGVAAVCFAIAARLHRTERHGHRHRHAAIVHEHTHRHDDGHHTHDHEGSFHGVEHSHVHTHEDVEHEHEHALDVHHRHSHG